MCWVARRDFTFASLASRSFVSLWRNRFGVTVRATISQRSWEADRRRHQRTSVPSDHTPSPLFSVEPHRKMHQCLGSTSLPIAHLVRGAKQATKGVLIVGHEVPH